jgi:hypothetical protein
MEPLPQMAASANPAVARERRAERPKAPAPETPSAPRAAIDADLDSLGTVI